MGFIANKKRKGYEFQTDQFFHSYFFYFKNPNHNYQSDFQSFSYTPDIIRITGDFPWQMTWKFAHLCPDQIKWFIALKNNAGLIGNYAKTNMKQLLMGTSRLQLLFAGFVFWSRVMTADNFRFFLGFFPQEYTKWKLILKNWYYTFLME